MRCYTLKIWLILTLAFSGLIGNTSLSLANDNEFTVIICTPTGFQQITIDENGETVIDNLSAEELSFQPIDCQLCTVHTAFLDTTNISLAQIAYTHKIHYVQKVLCASRIRLQSHHSVRAPPHLS